MYFDILPYVFVPYLPMFLEINLIQLLYKKIVLIFEPFLCFVPYYMKGCINIVADNIVVDNIVVDNIVEDNIVEDNIVEDNIVEDIV